MQNTSFDAQRLGIHYFPDSDHFGMNDLQRWLPRMQSLGIHWITLRAPSNWAIPENFLLALNEAKIQSVVHLPLSLESPPTADELSPIFSAYAKRGVRYLAFFDRPNLRTSWPNIGWTQRNLVERFLEVFLPLAHATLEKGLTPLFPPLEPGGDYWDTAFLRAALEEMISRGEGLLLEQMGLSAYVQASGKALDWGIGGPENWPASLPYSTPEDSQDQRGFRIFDWYNAIARATLGREMPLLVLAAEDGLSSGSEHARIIDMAQNIAFQDENDILSPLLVPKNVLAFNFRLLAAAEGNADEHMAWFDADGAARPIVAEWQAWKQNSSGAKRIIGQEISATATQVENSSGLFRHYLLLPNAERETNEQHFEAIMPFVRKHQATLGYSVAEAQRASRVTLVGGRRSFPEEIVQQLRQAGCQVEQIEEDGTAIATQLASL